MGCKGTHFWARQIIFQSKCMTSRANASASATSGASLYIRMIGSVFDARRLTHFFSSSKSRRNPSRSS